MNEEQEKAIVLHEVFQLPPAAAGDAFNFINESLQFLTRWCIAYPEPITHGASAYSCLVGCERINTDVERHNVCVERKLFREDTPADFLGRLYLCSYPLSRVFSQDINFGSLHDCETSLANAGFSDRPVVFYNAAERRILWRLGDKTELRQVMIRDPASAKLTSARFDEELQNFHCNYTETPQGLTKPWYSAPKLLTKLDLEEEIRDDLFIYLRHLSPEPMSVIREFYNSAGRTDLLVYFPEEKLIYYIELKVLRGWEKNGDNRSRVKPEDSLNWGKKGIAQAHSYRRLNKQPGAGYACCFDAREQDVELPELVDFAGKMDVQYRRYFMYPSAGALQAKLMS